MITQENHEKIVKLANSTNLIENEPFILKIDGAINGDTMDYLLCDYSHPNDATFGYKGNSYIICSSTDDEQIKNDWDHPYFSREFLIKNFGLKETQKFFRIAQRLKEDADEYFNSANQF